MREKKIAIEGKYGKIRGDRKSNLNHFLLLKLLPNLHEFWINQKISSQGLFDLCSIKLIASLIANPPELLFGQEMLHDNLQDLH
jgi:hypothetical protein